MSGGISGRTRSLSSTMWTPGLALPDLRVEAASHAPDEVLDLAGRLDPAEAGAAHDEGELRLPLVGVGLELSPLEHLDDPIAECERIGECLHADRVLGDALDAERRRLAAERDDERVVVQPMRVAVAAQHGHHLAIQVDRLDVARSPPSSTGAAAGRAGP